MWDKAGISRLSLATVRIQMECTPKIPEGSVASRVPTCKQYRPVLRSLQGASARDDVGDVLSFGIGTRSSFGSGVKGVCFSVPPAPIAPSGSKISEESAVESVFGTLVESNELAKDWRVAQLHRASALSADAKGPQTGIATRGKWFRINIAKAPVAQLDRASAF